MTPGQAFAALSATVALAVAACAWARGDRDAVRIALGFAACVALMRVFKGALPEDLHLIAFAALWVAFGAAAVRVRPLAGAALILSGLSYGLVALVGAPTHYGIPPMVAADVAGYVGLAVLFVGVGGGKRRRVPGTPDLGRDHRGRRILADRGDCLCQQTTRAR